MSVKSLERRNKSVGGIVLIVIGLIALIGQFVALEWWGLLFLPALGLLFLFWGILTRQSGLMIPGGILTGLGLGTLLMVGPFDDLVGESQAGAFMLAFAFGWLLITVASALFGDETHWWPLIPGAIMALIGGGLLFGGAAWDVMVFVGKIWPAFLILGGLWLIFRRQPPQVE